MTTPTHDVQGLGLVPAPLSVERGDGWFALPDPLRVTGDERAREVAELLAEYLAPVGAAVHRQDGDITLLLDPGEAVDEVEPDQGYRLDVDEHGVRISAASTAGLRHGVQTLRQLLPTAIFGGPVEPGTIWQVPFVHIVDRPRFGWRGSLLDVGRWCLPLDYLYRYVETLAVHKLNRLHLHLTEDQGWRFEVHRHPELTRVGAWRSGSPVGHENDAAGDDGVAHGGFYTQDQLRDLVAFAARRGVVIVPAVDLPGHVTSALTAYPHLGNILAGQSAPGPYAVSTHWGVHEQVLNMEDATVQFCLDVLDELLSVFPGRWVHLGGDECPTTEWAASPRALERVRELGLGGVQDLQAWFLGRLCDHLRAHGRVPVVWDEAFTETLAPDAIVMAWRNAQIGLAAARAGRQVVMAPQERTYFDHYQRDPATHPDEPLAIGGLTRLDDVLGFDPAPAELDDDARARVIGTQGQLWTEYLPTPARVDDMAYPRLSALADRAWGTGDAGEADSLARLAIHAERLIRSGVRMRPLE